MSPIRHDNNFDSEVLDHFKDKIQELVNDDLFEDLSIVVHVIDIQTGETSLLGNGCILCHYAQVDKTIQQLKIKHNHDQ